MDPAPSSTGEKTESENNANVDLSKGDGHAAVVASHYNTIEEKGLEVRNLSRIVHLRNFNNWIKSMLIGDYLKLIQDKKKYGSPVRALDLCCGKGGDLLKWRVGKITHLICADIAQVSMDDCKKRYEESKQKNRSIYSAEFFVADLTKTRIRPKFADASVEIDIASCQFAFHYCFESLPQAECMLKNASECLRPGGYFIGTIPDANAIVSKQRAAGKKSFGNEVYSISFEEDCDNGFPLFGAKYHFNLDGVVNCPEFLVHFPTLVKLAKKFKLQLVLKKSFEDFFNEKCKEGKLLLNRMTGLEAYPPAQGEKSAGTSKDEYSHAEDFLAERQHETVGTLSKSEWEVACLYMVFVFQKC